VVQAIEEVVPITPQQFQEGVEERIAEAAELLLAFLKSHDMAYSVDELAAELSLEPAVAWHALLELYSRGAIDGGDVGQTTYFISRRLTPRP
jgi:hypothetical protein